MAAMSSENLEQIRSIAIGKTLSEVLLMAESAGWLVRVVKKDEKACVGTRDVKPWRINVCIVGSVVTEVISLG
jgi:hypothetical protein